MTGRQTLDRAALRFAGIDIRLAGQWEPIPEAIRQAAPEIAEACRLFPRSFDHCETIADLADRIGDRFEGEKFFLNSFVQ